MDLSEWVSVSRTRSNVMAVAATALLIGGLFVIDAGAPERAAFVRRTGMFMVVLHGFFHALSIYGLRLMALRGIENAELALALYCHPRRISHLDLAAVWVATFAVAPYILQPA